jgi:oxygen-independent coproporphyrinogen-3 oxidase
MTATGIYIHIPFCLKKCAYCDFYSITDAALKPHFVTALTAEIEQRSQLKETVDTLYFGGGTPSLLELKDLEHIFHAVARNFNLTKGAEITLEANPATLSFEKLAGLQQMGINRINIGVQSFQDKQLNLLGRRHNAQDAHQCLSAARRAGFDNLGLDLIYGLPGQTEELWLKDLTTALSHAPEHISCYMLTYEDGTLLDTKRRKGKITPCDEALTVHFFELTSKFLTLKNYQHYEISNFARKDATYDYRSRHNRKYWNLVPYLGFGPAAHSFSPWTRSWNLRDVKGYIKALSEKRLPIAETEELSLKDQRLEAVYLGLRQSEGINLKAFEEKFKERLTDSHHTLIARLVAEKMALVSPVTLALTVRGMRYLDSIVTYF